MKSLGMLACDIPSTYPHLSWPDPFESPELAPALRTGALAARADPQVMPNSVVERNAELAIAHCAYQLAESDTLAALAAVS